MFFLKRLTHYGSEFISRRRQTKRKQKGKRHNNEFFDDQLSPSALRTLQIEKLSHEGRGIAKHNGKTQFVEGALIGETVTARLLNSHNTYDELQVVEILKPSTDRVKPFCQHFDMCGGCSLQNMLPSAQLLHKETVLKEQYAHFGQVNVNVLMRARRCACFSQQSVCSYVRVMRLLVRLCLCLTSSPNKRLCGLWSGDVRVLDR